MKIGGLLCAAVLYLAATTSASATGGLESVCFSVTTENVDAGFGRRDNVLKWTNDCDYSVLYAYRYHTVYGHDFKMINSAPAHKHDETAGGTSIEYVGSCNAAERDCYRRLRAMLYGKPLPDGIRPADERITGLIGSLQPKACAARGIGASLQAGVQRDGVTDLTVQLYELEGDKRDTVHYLLSNTTGADDWRARVTKDLDKTCRNSGPGSFWLDLLKLPRRGNDKLLTGIGNRG